VEFYLSQDANGSTANDILLSRTLGAGNFFSHSSVPAGATGAVFAVELQLPGSLPGGWTGSSFYIIMRTDSAGQVAEGNETNNFGEVGDGRDRSPVTIVADNTFLLHSRPAATKKIFLDLDGHTTIDPFWDPNPVVTPRYDSDNDTSAFSATELAQVREIWARVAEYFAPFDVDVTTEDPGVDGLTNAFGGDTEWGIRVVIGGDNSWYGSATGVAGLGVFGDNIDCFVFADNLGDSPIAIASTTAHEVGHTLGLGHDGRISPAETYYGGHGTGATRWQPIMGSGPVTGLEHWSKGEYASANNTQDDLLLITTRVQNSFGYRPDDHVSVFAGATGLTNVSSTALTGTGNIEQQTDLDYFQFTVTTAGTVDIDVDPATYNRMIDAQVELYNSSFSLLATDNPADQVFASITQSLAAGTYYLKIDGVGKPDPLVTGYTDYGSLGNYVINVTATGGAIFADPLPAPLVAAPLANGRDGGGVAPAGAFIASADSDGRVIAADGLRPSREPTPVSFSVWSASEPSFTDARRRAFAGDWRPWQDDASPLHQVRRFVRRLDAIWSDESDWLRDRVCTAVKPAACDSWLDEALAAWDCKPALLR
jgi:hypothetical protein